MLAAGLADDAAIITLMLVFDDNEDAPSVKDLNHRILQLEDSFPLLGCHVADPLSREARFVKSNGSPPQVIEKRVARIDAQAIFQREINDAEDISATGPRLWRVHLYHTDKSAALVLTIHHVIIDGVGAHHLFRLLIDGDIPELENEPVPPTLDSTVKVKIGLGDIVSTLWTEEIRPRIPAWLLTPNWNGPLLTDPQKRPAGHPTGCRLLRIEPAVVARMKALAKQHDVMTLQPVLQTAFDLALWHEYRTRQFFIVTPMSERDDKLGHPLTTGNYISPLIEHVKVRPDKDDFWSLARKHKKLLASPQGRLHARKRNALAALVPADSWVKTFHDKASSKRPYASAIMVTNLGPSLGPLKNGSTSNQLWWSQPAEKCFWPMNASVVGDLNGGIAMSLVWREDSAIEAEEAERLLATVERVLGRLGEVSSMNELVQKSL